MNKERKTGNRFQTESFPKSHWDLLSSKAKRKDGLGTRTKPGSRTMSTDLHLHRFCPAFWNTNLEHNLGIQQSRSWGTAGILKDLKKPLPTSFPYRKCQRPREAQSSLPSLSPFCGDGLGGITSSDSWLGAALASSPPCELRRFY